MRSAFSLTENEFGELIWENGQIVVHDHQPRHGRIPDVGAAFPSFQESRRDKHADNGSRLDRFDLFAGGAGPGAPADDDLVPWMSYPVEEPVPALPADFCSDFLDEFAADGLGLSSVVDLKPQEPAAADHLLRWKAPNQPASNVAAGPSPATADAACRDSAGGREAAARPARDGSVMNFSFFTRAAATAKPFEPAVNRCSGAAQAQSLPASALSNFESKSSDNGAAATAAKESIAKVDAFHRAGKAGEPAVAPSVCSVNDNGMESSDSKNREKKRARGREESCSNGSEDMDDEASGTRRSSNVRASRKKRSRAAEVHNLSERRRRERINEKMKALQELIPNCNKTDKASMLEDAIEYLKSLHLQVQMMSTMGGGLCMPRMMLPPAMRQPLMPGFQPMAVGMGIGYGMGMGMYDLRPQPGFPVMPVPRTPFHGLVGAVNPQMLSSHPLAATAMPQADTTITVADSSKPTDGSAQEPASAAAVLIPGEQKRESGRP